MNIKTILYSLLLLNILTLISQEVYSKNLDKGEWTQIIIEDFNLTEQFFLRSGCQFSYPSLHVYDWTNAKWLLPEESTKITQTLIGKFSIISYSAMNKLPMAERLKSCPMNVSREQMSAFIGKNIKIDEQYMLLLFEPPFNPKTGRSHLEDSKKAFAQKGIQLLESRRSFANLIPIHTKLSIKTSYKGITRPGS